MEDYQYHEDKPEVEYFRSIHPVDSSVVPFRALPGSLRDAIDRGISTGWASLDRYMLGLRKGEVTVITADTGAGKTTFALHLCYNCVMQDTPVYINSWEMKPEIILRKIASIALRRPLKIANFNDHENEQYEEWVNRHEIYLNPSTLITDINAFSKCLLQAKNRGIKVVLIDHLDYLVSSKKTNMYEAIDETIKRLHELAFGLDMHFILICHPRQSANAQEQIGLHGIKGSSSIKQYADNILILHRVSRSDPKADKNLLRVTVAKNRMFGLEGSINLYYRPQFDGYTEEQCNQ